MTGTGRDLAARRPGPTRAFVSVALLAVLVVSGCARSGPGGGPAPSGPAASDALVLRIQEVGGFIDPQAMMSRVPTFSLFADGRAIVPGAVPAIYPGPAVAPLLVLRVDSQGMRRVREAAVAAGLSGPSGVVSGPGMPDAPTTEFVFVQNGVRHVISVPGGQGSTGPAARLAALQTKLLNLRSWLGKHVGPASPYKPVAAAVAVLRPSSSPTDPSPNVVAWPLAHRPLASFGSSGGLPWPGVRCGVVAGADFVTLWPAAGRATQITLWTSEGHAYSLALRPLLPDERSCPAVDPASTG